MISDSSYDLVAAQASNIECYCVSTESNDFEEMAMYVYKNLTYNNLYDLGKYVFELNHTTSSFV